MTKKITFLGIETSCDETAAAVIKENSRDTADILSNIVSSQISEHKKFGGVVPELAARAHLENIDYIVNKALEKSKINLSQIDGVAATAGPGLTVCLTIGLNIGKSIAAFSEKPFVGINHLEGHALSPGLETPIDFPYLLLLISGGHTQYLIVKDVGKYEQLGTTIDDALGEAFDKTSKMLNLGYPGGPCVEKFSKLGNKNFFKLPEPIINKAGCNLSFAGLKTAVLRITKKINTDQEKFDLAASFQKTVIAILNKKTKIAFEEFEKQMKIKEKKFVVAGGVAANKEIRNMLIKLCKEKNYEPIFPPIELCGDNAAMIGMVGLEKFKLKDFNNLDYPAKPRWPLDEQAAFLKGAGVKL